MIRSLFLFFALSLAAHAASGKVVFLGSEIDSGNASGSDTCSTVYDGSFTTFWSANQNNWCGMDMGAQVTLASYLVTPRQDSSACEGNDICFYRISGNGATVIEASNASDFSTGVVTLDTITNYPYLPQFQYNSRSVSPGGTYRYYRVRSPQGYGDISELRWIGNAQSGVNAQPVAPSISPWGGIYVNAAAGVTLASLTTSASIYYTTDGSTPNCTPTGTHYTGAFRLPVIGTVTFKAIACDSSLSTPASTVSSATFQSHGFEQGDTWYAIDSGNVLNPFAGGIFGPVNGTYYRTGQWMQMVSTGGDSGPSNDPGITPGVWLYSSTDLYNWQYEGQILDDAGWIMVQRPHVVYDAGTGNYVLWAHCLSTLTTSSYRACIATSTTPNGPATGANNWAWVNTSYQPDSNSFGDDYLFLDDDGSAYIAYANYPSGDIIISKLDSTFQTTIGSNVVANSNNHESPVLFKRNGIYFLISGPYTDYGADARTITYQTASSILGTWSSAANLFVSDPYTTCQPTAAYAVPAKIDGYMFMLDCWGTPIATSTELALPLTFPTSTSLVAQTPSTWDLSYFVSTNLTGASISAAGGGSGSRQ